MATPVDELLGILSGPQELSRLVETRGLYFANQVILSKGSLFDGQGYDLSGCVFYRCIFAANFNNPSCTVINSQMVAEVTHKALCELYKDALVSNTDAGQFIDLTDADLEGANLQNAYMKGIIIRRANLQGANLENADLTYTNLQQANLQGANLQGANLQGANLLYANLQGANLQGANLQGANLEYANLQAARLVYADLENASLNHADLQDANLQWVNLQNVGLSGTNLQDADLRGADLLKSFILGSTNVDGAFYDDDTKGLGYFDKQSMTFVET